MILQTILAMHACVLGKLHKRRLILERLDMPAEIAGREHWIKGKLQNYIGRKDGLL